MIEHHDPDIPLSPEGIPVDMIGHFPSDEPTSVHHAAVNLADDTDPMN